MEWRCVRFEVSGGLAVLTLNRPETMNSLNSLMCKEIEDACGRCSSSGARALVVSGEGRAFCAGGDIKEIGGRLESGEKMEAFLGPDYQAAVAALYETHVPTIAAGKGHAVGGGFDLALACDIRLAGESARFSQIYSQVGLVPDCGGTYLLSRVIGPAKALELILTGEMLDARQAHELGLVRAVFPDEDLMEEALSLGRRLASGATLALSAAKGLMKNPGEFRAALAAEAAAQGVTSRSADFREGLAAFGEKRPPRFQGS